MFYTYFRSEDKPASEKPALNREDSFLDQDFDDLLGDVDDDIDQDMTGARTQSMSKAEDDLLLEMEELLA